MLSPPALRDSWSGAASVPFWLDRAGRGRRRLPVNQGITSISIHRRHRGVTRQALLLDVKEALVDEFVDAEGA